MWVCHAIWIVQDDGFEIGVGDLWSTRVEVDLAHAAAVDDSAPSMNLAADPFGVRGPVYDIVARITDDELIGPRLDAGALELAPTSYASWPEGTLLRFTSELHAQPCLFNDPPDPLIRTWTVLQLFIRQWKVEASPDGAPNSFRPNRSTVQVRPTERMRMWEDEKSFDGQSMTISDYLLELR